MEYKNVILILIFKYYFKIRSGQSVSSVAKSCLTLCDPMNCSTPGLPVHHQLPEFTQTHVHWVGDAIQPSHPLSSPSPLAPNPSQHQGLFQWVNFISALASFFPMNTQDWSPSEWTGWISSQSKGLYYMKEQGINDVVWELIIIAT